MKTLLLLPFTTLLGLIAHQTIVDAATIELTPDNFDDMTAGKTVFIKFFAPWYVSAFLLFLHLRLVSSLESTTTSS